MPYLPSIQKLIFCKNCTHTLSLSAEICVLEQLEVLKREKGAYIPTLTKEEGGGQEDTSLLEEIETAKYS